MTSEGNILVVDDDRDIREVLALILSSEGYSVHGAANGYDALAIVRDGARWRLILLDMMMPVMDGEDFVRALTDDERAAIPIVIMSGQPGVDETARALGVQGFLRKPVELAVLLGTIHRFAPLTFHPPQPGS